MVTERGGGERGEGRRERNNEMRKKLHQIVLVVAESAALKWPCQKVFFPPT